MRRWALWLACVASSACTAILYSGAEQCETTADCVALGLPGTECGGDGLCRAPSVAACSTNAECATADLTERYCAAGAGCLPVASFSCTTTPDCSTLGSPFDGYVCEAGRCVQPACTSSSTCLELSDGVPSACIDGLCVQLTTPDCTEVFPSAAIGADNTVYFGFMGPLVDDEQTQFSSLGIPIKQGFELALSEIEQQAKGIPGGPGGTRRKLAMIACHDLGDPLATARHLIEVVKVPAIGGPAFSGITLDVSELTIPAGVLLLSASATSPAITGLDDDGLVWRTAPSDAIQAIPLAELTVQLEARIRSEQELEMARLRVVAINKGDAYGQGLRNALTPILVFNGRSAAGNDDDFLPIEYPDPSQTAVDFSSYVNQILAYRPHLVLGLGTSEVVERVMTPVEASWADQNPGVARPYWLIPDGGRVQPLLDAVAAAIAAGNPTLRTRVKGTVPGRKGANYDDFALRYRALFGNEDPSAFSENAYDAGYLLAFGILAGGAGPVTGALIAHGLTGMGAGTKIVVGPNQINDAFAALGSGASIDFDGASGELDFDVATGEAESDIDIWCIRLDGNGEPDFISSGQFYDAAVGDVVGNDACPP